VKERKSFSQRYQQKAPKAFDKSLPRKSCKKKKASQRGERERDKEEKRSVFEGKWRRKQKG